MLPPLEFDRVPLVLLRAVSPAEHFRDCPSASVRPSVRGDLQFDPSTKSSLDHATMQLENEGKGGSEWRQNRFILLQNNGKLYVVHRCLLGEEFMTHVALLKCYFCSLRTQRIFRSFFFFFSRARASSSAIERSCSVLAFDAKSRGRRPSVQWAPGLPGFG